MVAAAQLPPRKTAYDYPLTMPGQELTPEQEEQLIVARIAGIIVATATAKTAIEAATVNQIVALMRVSDLLTETGVKAFAKMAAMLVGVAVRKARVASWSAVSSRAKAAGVTPPGSIPPENDFPKDVRYSRGTDLETAYARIADEYRTNLQRTADDPIIKALIEEFEAQGLTPLPRPDNISSDAVRTIDGEAQEWEEAFLRAEKASQGQSRKDPIAEISAKEAEPTQGTGSSSGESKAWLERDISDLRGSFLTVTQDVESDEPLPGADGEDGEEQPKLIQSEIEAIIEKYAQHKAEERAERMVSQDLAATMRNAQKAATDQMDKKQIAGFRRVVHPELAKSGQSCGLCIVASTMVYTKGSLMPIHAGCNCGIAEIYDLGDDGILDPGDQINISDLDVFYREAGGTTHGWALKRQRYEVRDHPEYGPTLENVTSKKSRKTAEAIPFEENRVRRN